MARRSREGEPPLWLDIALQPGVIEVLVALFNRDGPLSFNDLCECVPGRRSSAVAVRAVRRLGACGLLRRTGRSMGSWDDPAPSTQFELTDRGYGYARTIGDLGWWAAHRLPASQGFALRADAGHGRHDRLVEEGPTG
jgi:hypothetical protein